MCLRHEVFRISVPPLTHIVSKQIQVGQFTTVVGLYAATEYSVQRELSCSRCKLSFCRAVKPLSFAARELLVSGRKETSAGLFQRSNLQANTNTILHIFQNPPPTWFYTVLSYSRHPHSTSSQVPPVVRWAVFQRFSSRPKVSSGAIRVSPARRQRGTA